MKARVLTALVAIPLVLAVVGSVNPLPILALLSVIGVLSLAEFVRLTDSGFAAWLGAAAISGVLLAAYPLSVSASYGIGAGSFVLGVAALALWIRGSRSRILAAIGTGWIIAPLFFVAEMVPRPSFAVWDWRLPNDLMFLLLPVWAGDTAAMLAGRAFGKHLMAPRISPKKTWEGAVANFIASVLAGWGVAAWMPHEYGLGVGIACGAAVGIVGQFGDLFESALKRSTGQKDSGAVLPGHGGVLDRIDALLASVIPVWYVLHLANSHLGR